MRNYKPTYRKAPRMLPGSRGLNETRDWYSRLHGDDCTTVCYPEVDEDLYLEQERQSLITGIKVGLLMIVAFLGFLGFFALMDALWL